MMRSVVLVVLFVLVVLTGCAVPLSSAQAQFMPYLPPPVPQMQVQPLPPPPPAIVYPSAPAPRACEQVCRPLRDGGYRCSNVCYGG